MRILARVSYEDVLGELRESIFLKLKGYKDFMLLRAPISIRKGWLTKSIEDLLLIRRIVHFARLKKERAITGATTMAVRASLYFTGLDIRFR